MVGRLFLAVPLGCLRFVIVVFPDRTHLLFLNIPVSPIYIDAIVLCNGKSRKTFVNHAIEVFIAIILP